MGNLQTVQEPQDQASEEQTTLLGAYMDEVGGHLQRQEPGILSYRWGRPRSSDDSTEPGIVVEFPQAPEASSIAEAGTSFRGVPVYVDLAE